MKKVFLIFILFFGIIMGSCSNSEGENEIKETINKDTWEISLKASENIQHKYLLMEAIPIEGGPQITNEPENSIISELSYEEDGIYYLYQPKSGFTGTDKVEITNRHSNGFEVYAQTILILNIEVSE